MAKKIKGGSVEFEVTDGGSLKKLEKNSKRAGEALGSVAKNAQEADRRLKGTANMSSNSTKNFAKQAQSISGGLVPAYATLAAQVFAVSAAFEFLKSAFNTRNLIEGQKAFSAVTGVAYRALTKDIKAATQGMLSFEEAAQAAAIGTAAGLTRGQLTQIGKAATDVSLALGRDLTDSFNRLVRGITKAEPELLDELGIILRLDPATKNYASSIGKAASDLTQFERSQAIANEVLGQAEQKFGMIQKIMDPNAFALGQFSAAFNDLMVKFKVGLVDFLTPAIKFLSENVEALVGALALGLAPVLRTILPDFKTLGQEATKTANAAKAAAAAARGDAALFSQRAAAASGEGRAGLMKSSAKQAKSLGIGLKGKGDDAGMLSKRQLAIYKNQLDNQVLLRKKYTEQEIRIFKEFIITQEALLAERYGKEEADRKKNEFSEKASRARMNAFLQSSLATATKAVGGFARAASFALSAVGWIGTIALVVSLGKEIMKVFNPQDAETKKLKERLEEIRDVTKDILTDLDGFDKVQQLGLLNFSGLLQQKGQAAASVDVAKVLRNMNEAMEAGDFENVKLQADAIQRLQKVLGSTIVPQEALNKAMEDGVPIQEDMIKKAADLAGQYIAAGNAAKTFAQQQQAVTNALAAATRADLPFAAEQGTMRAALEGARLQLSQAPGALQTIVGRMDSAKANVRDLRAQRAAASARVTAANQGFQEAKRAGASSESLEVFRKNSAQAEAAFNKVNREFKEGEKQLEDLNKQFIETNKEIEVMLQYVQRTEENLKVINILQKAGVAASLDKLRIDRDLANLPLNNEVGTKNARIDLNLQKESYKVHEAAAAVRAAELLIASEEEGTAKEIKESNAARLAIARATLETTVAQFVTSSREATKQKEINNLLEKQRLLTQRIAVSKLSMAAESGRIAVAGFLAGTMAQQGAVERRQIEQQKLNLNFRRQQVTLAQEEMALYAGNEDTKTEFVQAQERHLALVQSLISETNALTLAEAQLYLRREKAFNAQDASIQAQQMQVSAGRAAGFLGGATLSGQEFQKQALELMAAERKTSYGALSDESKNRLKETVNQAVSARIEFGMMQETSAAIQNSFSGLFDALLDGTKSLKQALGDMMQQLLADLAKAYLKAAALRMLQSAGLGIPGMGARYGGIMSPSGKSFAVGGIASGPTSGYMATLHGTEAVVPLGNDRSIPVELKGAGGGGNVVNVSVNVAADGQSSVNTQGDNMQGLGKVIGQAVQQELMRQKRPGGMLSPYGAA